jgi:glutamyl-tRNA synthetase
MYPITIALTFKSPTPGGASEIAHIIGKEETLRRIQSAIENLENSL